MRGTRRAFAISSGVNGRASGSAQAAASISSSVIGRIGVSEKRRSLPSASTSTSVPSGRILAIVVVLLIFRCPPGRDDSDPIAALRIGHVQDHALAHAEDVYALFAVVLAIVDFFDREWIAQRLGTLHEGNAVPAPVLGRLCFIPFKFV